MPKTERREQLKIYGDAPDTVSVSIVTVALPTCNPAAGPAGKFALTEGSAYVNVVSLITCITFVEILKSASLTPRILIGVPELRP